MTKIDDVKIVLLKGEKGDVGEPSDEQVKAQIAQYAKDNPSAFTDVEVIVVATQKWLESQPLVNVQHTEDGTFQLPMHTINDNTTASDSTWSSQKINGLYATKTELTAYAKKTDLSTYATKTELNTKANTNHTHDDRYYTETETDTLLGAKQNKITYGTADPSGGSNGDIYIKYKA